MLMMKYPFSYKSIQQLMIEDLQVVKETQTKLIEKLSYIILIGIT